MTQGRSRGVPVRVGRADLDQLPRLRRLRAAAARAGLRRARDAEHPRGVRAEARHQPRGARAVGSAVLASAWSKRRSWPIPICRRRTPTRSSRTCRSSKLLSKEYAATLCGRIDPNVASKPAVTGGTDGGTIYLTTADRWGNMVSLIHSVFSVYGSRATVRAVRLRAAQPRRRRSRSIRRARTSSRRTSGRSTPSSPAS